MTATREPAPGEYWREASVTQADDDLTLLWPHRPNSMKPRLSLAQARERAAWAIQLCRLIVQPEPAPSPARVHRRLTAVGLRHCYVSPDPYLRWRPAPTINTIPEEP